MWRLLLFIVYLGHVNTCNADSMTNESHIPHRTTQTSVPMRTTLTSPTRTESAIEVTTVSRRGPMPQTIEFPDSNGKLHEVDLTAEPDHKLLGEIDKHPSTSMAFLYTRDNVNKPNVLITNNEASIKESYYRKGLTTYVLVHGFLGDRNVQFNVRIKNTLLHTFDANVIVVDWRKLSHSDYVTATLGVPTLGRHLGEFLHYLSTMSGNPISDFHLIGHSLGAHLVGNAGRTLGGKVGRITALDPAGPLWLLNPDSIADQDALYVEAIHTDGKLFGLLARIGHADFYVNGGETQPGCVTDVCSHMRSWRLFEVSLTNNVFVGHECEDEFNTLIDTCNGRALVMGNANVRKRGSGVYRVNTRSRYPYF